MSEAIRFLHAFAQALSTMTLYSPGHPATKRGVENLWQAMHALLAIDPRPVFLFLGTAPVYNGRALHELRDWQHSQRLADAGVQRLEFDDALTLESLGVLLERMMVRLTTGNPVPDEDETPLVGIAYGTVAVYEDDVPPSTSEGAQLEGGSGELLLDLTDELDTMEFVRTEGMRGVVARAEAEAVARILGRLIGEPQVPQASHGGDPERYHVVHPVNAALLAMVAATTTGIDGAGRHRIGVMALLHDIGMTRLPAGLGNRESLNAERRALVETHTAEGARLLLDAGSPGLELAAIVAYEHHLRPDGTGYPARRFRAAAHWASRLIGACSTFTSLRLVRPYRPAWSVDRAARHLEEGAGTVFDPEAAKLVASIVRRT
jgi:HD domain